MKMNKVLKTLLALVLCLGLALSLGACQKGPKTTEQWLKSMKTQRLPNKIASIKIERLWTVHDTGEKNILVVGSDDGNDAISLFQFAKNGGEVSSLEEVKAQMEQRYQVTQSSEDDSFLLAGLDNAISYRSQMTLNEHTVESCMAYGESDYAYYALCYASGVWEEEEDLPYIQAVCQSFQENSDKIPVE